MEKVCIICNHPNKIDIDRLITQGYNIKSIAAEFNISEINLCRHKQNHININEALFLEILAGSVLKC